MEVNKEKLYEDYCILGMSTRDIAKKYNIGQTTVRRLMAKYDIKARSCNERTDYYYQKMQPQYDYYSKKYRKYKTNICEFCGKEFQVDGRHKNRKFCSKVCLSSNRKATKEKYYCQRCGQEILYKTNRVYKRSYCDECLPLIRSERQKNRIEAKCGWCGKPLQIIPANYRSDGKNYCDIHCMSLDYQQRFSGENSPTWKGGKKHYSGQWHRQAARARERDDYRCQLCGLSEKEHKNGRKLDVHHIKSYRDFEDPVQANRLGNLVSLCSQCHRYVHSNSNTDHHYLHTII